MRLEIPYRSKIRSGGDPLFMNSVFSTNSPNRDIAVRRSLMYGVAEAVKMQHSYIGSEHLLLGTLIEPTGRELFRHLKAQDGGPIDEDRVREKIMGLIKVGTTPVDLTEVSMTPVAMKIIDHGVRYADQLKLDRVTMVAHTLAIIGEEQDSVGVQALRNLGVDTRGLSTYLLRRA